MISCRELCALLCDICADDLTPECRVTVEEHLQVCSCCQTYLHSYQVTIQLGRKLPCPDLPEGVAQRLAELLAKIQKQD